MLAPMADHPPIALALGRIPSGLYIVTTVDAQGRPLGFLGSFVQQFGFAPPTVAVAVAQGREHLQAIRHSRCFAISVLDQDSKGAMPPFFGKLPAGATPFDVLPHRAAPGRAPVLENALAWLDLELTGEHALPDHVVLFGRVLDGGVTRSGEPLVHLRKNGLSY
jgi:flavin reductase (DIM6/NTAB) family NADH-FMN oxidoreductase RutF